MQHFVLNDEQELTINIEERLRILAANSDTNVLAFYDICRSELSKFKGFENKTGRGADEIEESGDGEFASKYNYVHIGTHPKHIVAAESKLAEMTIKQLDQKAQESGCQMITIPYCFQNMGGIDQTNTGEEYSIQWKTID